MNLVRGFDILIVVGIREEDGLFREMIPYVKSVLTACLRRVGKRGEVHKETREFQTYYEDLLCFADWLVASGCPIVALESTGV